MSTVQDAMLAKAWEVVDYVREDGGASVCLLGDDWHDTYLATGYPCCPRCLTHHRSPETCPGITQDGEPAEWRWHW